MNTRAANPLIETYVDQVAARLPRAQRQDVSDELQLLLVEELEARADAAGRPADEAMTLAMLQAFGRPSEVAARYRPPLTVIDPADGRSFLHAAWIGTAVLWALGLIERLRHPVDGTGQLLGVLGQWWVGSVIGSLWWPGLLVIGFGLTAWSRRRWPARATWQPPAPPDPRVQRVGHTLGLVGMCCGIVVLIDPLAAVALAFGGTLPAPAADAFTYTDSFRHRQGGPLLALLLLQIPLQVAAVIHGARVGLWRWLHIGLSVLTCLALGWSLLDGPVVRGAASNAFIRLAFSIVIAMTLLDLGRQAWQSRRRWGGPRPGWSGR